MKIGSREVGRGAPPFIVAELSGNHNGSLDRALALVDAAAQAGAHALKLQTFSPDTITIDANTSDFRIDDAQSLWNGRTLHDLYVQAHTPWDWHRPIMAHARSHGMLCFSTPFEERAVDFLEELDVPAYKIASFENNHLPLIRKAAATGKPLLLSTGMATIMELDEAVTAARSAGCRDIVLLKCTSTYPATPEDSNVRTIPHMRDLFGVDVGLSDHTLGVGAAVAAVALGATVIEKHFTLRRADGGLDAAFSMEPEELAALVRETERAWQSLGTIAYGTSAAESRSRVFRRSLYIVEDLKAGDVLTPSNLKIIRPGQGLHPRHYDHLLGRTVRHDVKRGTAVTWSLV